MCYLNFDEDCTGGTAFYRHKPTGTEIVKTLDQFKDIYKIDKEYYDSNGYPDFYVGNGDNQWELIGKVNMKFNRMVLYPENIFHSAFLEKNDFMKNNRKTQLLFS